MLSADELSKLDHTPLTFGQYKGRTPAQIAEFNPKYLVWLKDTVTNRGELVSDLLYRDCVKAPSPKYEKRGQSTTHRIPPPAGSLAESRSHLDDPNDIPF
jgi:uncharacterized protein (DUF3820 family)